MNPQPTTLMQIGNGQQANYNTLAIMRRIVNDAKKDGFVRQFAARLVNHLAQKDYYGEIETVHKYVRDNIRYVRDIRGLETLHEPKFIIQNKYGDCDDKTMLTCALLECLGHKTRMTICAINTPYYCHVFPEVFFNGKWLTLEVTEPVEIGWIPPNMTKTYSLEIKDNGSNMSAIQFDDYLTPVEQSSAIELMYLRHYFPDDYQKVVAFNRALKNTKHGELSEIEAFAYYTDEYNDNDGLGRFKLKKLFKKVTRVLKKANPVYLAAKATLPRSTYNKLKRFEQKHRATIKKVGAAVAMVGGGFLFAPSIIAAGSSIGSAVGGGIAKIGTLAKGAIVSVASKLGIKVPENVQAEIEEQIEKLPNSAKEYVQKEAQELLNNAGQIGADKLREIVAKYTKNGNTPFTSPDDPRLSQAISETLTTSSAQNTGVIDNQAVNASVIASLMADAQKLREQQASNAGFNNVNPVYLIGGVLILVLAIRR